MIGPRSTAKVDISKRLIDNYNAINSKVLSYTINLPGVCNPVNMIMTSIAEPASMQRATKMFLRGLLW